MDRVGEFLKVAEVSDIVKLFKYFNISNKK